MDSPSATLATASAQWAAWWPWVAIAALGLFHGINPAMGWLFAVALGLHRHKRSVVVLSLLPIALGHALAVAVFVAAALTLGSAVDARVFARVGGLVLIGWAAWHVLRGHRGRPRFGMQAGMAGLACWSFLMAGVHGAGLMLVPALMPLCASPLSGQISGGSAVAPAVLALGLHTGAMLLAICAVALLVYDRIGVAFLRTGWVNLDLVWSIALALCGVALLVW
ncbi:hypothetical protein LMG31506_05174 [Cupriavidus yeoncheonensis]|uniref:Arginine/ornithine antiporter ArcD n=1 Tax=Cupriavidus yeoncheonensis TaxID=1462994 RepID=A0A916N681_9BURK|nr:hypothetical protein [Cupriavidus yeoncheonensis]CAG2154727.1 hypothetical protein LMG31506_05174 [Cupriavidus yeoncheonensis]